MDNQQLLIRGDGLESRFRRLVARGHTCCWLLIPDVLLSLPLAYPPLLCCFLPSLFHSQTNTLNKITCRQLGIQMNHDVCLDPHPFPLRRSRRKSPGQMTKRWMMLTLYLLLCSSEDRACVRLSIFPCPCYLRLPVRSPAHRPEHRSRIRFRLDASRNMRQLGALTDVGRSVRPITHSPSPITQLTRPPLIPAYAGPLRAHALHHEDPPQLCSSSRAACRRRSGLGWGWGMEHSKVGRYIFGPFV